MIDTLKQFYGLQPTPPADLFQFFVWEILSDHALPARRDLAWQALRRLPALTPDAMFRTPAKDLLDAVGIAGPHREDRVDRLRAVVGEFKRHRDLLHADALQRATLLDAARTLRRLEHTSPASRVRALLFSLDRAVLPLDADLNRVVSRLMGMPKNRQRSRARRWLGQSLAPDTPRPEPAPSSTYRDATIYLRHHALQTCLPVAPHCVVCPLRERCAYRGSAS
jgi:endonuclease III